MPLLNTGLYANLQDLVALRQALQGRRIQSQQKIWAQMSGSHHALQKGRGMEFAEVRQYQAGDDVRTIDWRVTARTQRPHTKVFIEEQERPVILCLQQSPELFFGSHIRFKSVQALQVAAIFAWLTLQQNDRIGGYLFNHQQGDWIKPQHRQPTVMQLLQQALQLQKTLKQPQAYQPKLWLNHLKQLKSHLKPGGQVIVIGDLMGLNKEGLQQIQQLKRHHDLIACHIFDPLERQLPQLGNIQITDGQQSLQLDSSEIQWQQNYHHQYENRFQAIKQQLLKQKIPLIEISTHEDPIASLIQKGMIV